MISSQEYSNGSLVAPKKTLTLFIGRKKVTAISILVSGNVCRVKFKMEYLSFWWELAAQQPVQNDRNRYILWGE